jgi:hypothetical protein
MDIRKFDNVTQFIPIIIERVALAIRMRIWVGKSAMDKTNFEYVYKQTLVCFWKRGIYNERNRLCNCNVKDSATYQQSQRLYKTD